MTVKDNRIEEAGILVQNWNDNYPIGTPVNVQERHDIITETKTTSKASLMCGSAVVWLEGISGCYCLTHVQAVQVEIKEV